MTGADVDLIEAAMGLGVRAVVSRALALSEGGGCDHPDRPQVAGVSALTSTCWPCAWSTAVVEDWARGPCDVCNAAAAPPDRVWFLEPVAGHVFALHMCHACSRRELGNPDREDEVRLCNYCLDVATDAAQALTAGAAPRLLEAMHAECAASMQQALKGAVRRNTDLPRETRIAMLRVRWALTAGGAR